MKKIALLMLLFCIGANAQCWQLFSASGTRHVAAIKNDGTLWTWGDNNSGQLGDGTFDNHNIPTQIGTETDWKTVTGSFNYTVGIKADGTIWSCGYNYYGQLGNGENGPINYPTILQIGTATDWKSITAIGDTTFAIKLDGTLWACGWSYSNVMTQVGTSNDWKAITGGIDSNFYAYEPYYIGIKTDDSVWAWGNNNYGQYGNGTTLSTVYPQEVGNAADWKSYSAGKNRFFIIKNDGTLWGWGRNDNGWLGNGNYVNSLYPAQIGTANNWSSISTNNYSTSAVKTNGTLWVWGYVPDLGIGTGIDYNLPQQAGVETDWEKSTTGNLSLYGIKSDGTLYSCGQNSKGELGIANNSTTSIFTPVGCNEINTSCWLMVAGGIDFSLGIKEDGTLWSWGNNNNGQLGISNNISTNYGVRVGTDTNWKTISAHSSGSKSLALKTDGTLWQWGFESGNSPIQITTDTDWKFISQGHSLSTAIKNDGTLWTWGTGPLGNGEDGLNTTTPVQILNNSTWITVAAGNGFTLAIKSDGTLWSWGDNQYGQLGLSNTLNQLVAQQVGNDNDWKTIAIGFYMTLAIKTNGTLWGCGSNAYHQLGVNSENYSTIMLQIGGLSGWAGISAGQWHSLGVKSDGTSWVWGTNYSGQLAMPNPPLNYVGIYDNPTKISLSSDWKAAIAGAETTMLLKNDGALWCTGRNDSGQLGNQTNFNVNQITYIECPTAEMNLGIEKDIKQPFTIYPNPVNDKLFIETSDAQSIDDVVAYDVTGKIMFRKHADVKTIDTSALLKGVYFLEINAGGNIYHYKFLKK